MISHQVDLALWEQKLGDAGRDVLAHAARYLTALSILPNVFYHLSLLMQHREGKTRIR
jgi:hypothetical protein